MIDKINKHNKSVPEEERITVSVEIEKAREECKLLLPKGDVVCSEFIAPFHPGM